MASAPWRVDEVERVRARPERLRHAPAVGRKDDRVHVDVLERLRPHELEAHHHHPRHPEVDDVPGRGQDLRGEVGAQLLGVLGPAQDGERPQRRREPGVEDVRVARQLARAAGRTCGRLGLLDDGLAAAAVPHGQLVAPPQLARDAPGADVVHPVEVDALAALGVEPHAAFVDGRVGRASQLGHLAEPLQGDERLDAVAGAVAVADGVAVRPLGAEQAPLGEVRHHQGARLVGGLAGIAWPRRVGHAPVEPDDRDLGQPVAARDLEVVRIVARRDLERARAKPHLDVLVGDDRDLALGQRDDGRPAHQVAVALVSRVHGHRGVAQHRRRADGGHRHVSAAHERIVDLVQRVVDVDVPHLEVRDGARAHGAPVDDAGVPEEVALVVQGHEHAQHGVGRTPRPW